ncbi:MAG: AAA family ATPase, partial [Bryobacterales bacterium]|nr:AAA family ATPase [Bryobacterales bacterium]
MTSEIGKRRLPIGIQTFRTLRKDGCHYVDKTGFALDLIRQGTHYFLSRPRRFGKSLFVDTLKELFEGSRELFHGLEAYDRWDWSVRYPVVRLEFGRGDYAQAGHLHTNLMAQIDSIDRLAGLRSACDSGPERLARLLEMLRLRAGRRVVVLVDEYDKPILDALHKPDIAKANRDYLQGLYSVIKSCDAHVRFCLLTGVSKFSKVNLFSGLNNLRDITLTPRYSSICGYSERDLDAVFAPELDGLDRDLVRDWYNGYSWGGLPMPHNRDLTTAPLVW